MTLLEFADVCLKRRAAHSFKVVTAGIEITRSGSEIVREKDYAVSPESPGYVDLFHSGLDRNSICSDARPNFPAWECALVAAISICFLKTAVSVE